MPSLIIPTGFPQALVAIVTALLTAFPVFAQPQTISPDGTAQSVVFATHFGRATQVVVPQAARSYDVNVPWPQAEFNRRPGQPVAPTGIAIDGVEARVEIRERTARTTMEISLRNLSRRQEEAVLLLPVPDHAVVGAFTFDGSASEPTAQVLPHAEARELYDSIVARLKDPALLEFAGYNLIRSSVFPVAPGGTQKVRLTYEHLLGGDGDRIDYLLPRSESLEGRSPWNIAVDITSANPVSTVYSPSHEIVAERRGAGKFHVRLGERASLEPGPFRLSYLPDAGGLSASLFAYPDPSIGGGYFLLMAGLPANLEGPETQVRREVTLVIDRSGSMAGEKMDQVRAAALQVVEGLADGEAFNIIDYSSTVSMFAPGPVVKTPQASRDARRYLASIRPVGGTNIHDALLESLHQAPTPGTLPIVLFLTDGLPTIGRTSEVAIRDMVKTANPHGRRVFTFGVGEDVNVPLLDRVAESTGGASTYVLPHEDVELKVARVFRRLYGPVFARPRIETIDTAGTLSTRMVRELIPDRLPDLFDGDQLVLLGQYQGTGPITFRLTGDYLGKQRAFRFLFDLDRSSTRNAFVPRLWASRRIAFLIDQIRQDGAGAAERPTVVGASMLDTPKYLELVEEILRLSTEFGILTEYTAFLATEGTDLSDWEKLRLGCSTEIDRKAVRTRSGVAAVNQAINFNQQKGQQWLNYGNRYVNAQLESVEFSAVRQVNDRAFFRRGNRWIDSRLINAAGAPPEPNRVLMIGTPEFLDLLHRLEAEHRQGTLSLPGEILLRVNGEVVLVQDGC